MANLHAITIITGQDAQGSRKVLRKWTEAARHGSGMLALQELEEELQTELDLSGRGSECGNISGRGICGGA